jgi:hypothetical protein
MTQPAQPDKSASARRPSSLSLALHASLALAAFALFQCALGGTRALASGALPWLAPGQQQNGAGNATLPPPAPAADSQPAAALSPQAEARAKAQIEVLRQYFRRQMTLDENFPQVFSRRVKNAETLAFETMCEMQSRRGLLERFRAGKVDVTGLAFTQITNDPDLARIRVTGRYTFTLGPKTLSTDSQKADAETAAPVQEILEEDALFVLLPEMGEWKIYERREGWQPWP